MSSIRSKTVLVTGGASGLGRLLGIGCLEQGASALVIWDIDAQNLEETSRRLTDSGYVVHPYQVDLSDVNEISEAAEKVRRDVGPVDILFNNAGVVEGKLFHEHTHKSIRKTIDVNVSALMHVTLEFLPGMQEQEHGHIINMASAAGLTPNPRMSVYASSKWAVVGWSESLRIELEQNYQDIHVTTVTPSYINTGMFDGVKGPRFTPILEPNYMAGKIIYAVNKNRILLREPFTIKLLPLFRGIMPARVFDFVADHLFQVYSSMDDFKGRRSINESNGEPEKEIHSDSGDRKVEL